MTETKTTFFGIPVKGEHPGYYSTRRSTPQKSGAELKATIDAIFATGVVEAIVWHQYTPYFNDGDPCVFHKSLNGLVLKNTEEEHEAEPAGFDWDYETFKRKPITYLSTYRYYPADGLTEDQWKTLVPLYSDIASAAYDDVCLDKFGDPAQVVVTPTEIHISHYDHD